MTKKYRVVITTSGEHPIAKFQNSALDGVSVSGSAHETSVRIITSSDQYGYESFLQDMNRKLWGAAGGVKEPTQSAQDELHLTAP